MSHIVNKEVFEIFDDFTKATNKAGRIAVIIRYKHHAGFLDVLRGTFDDRLKFIIPKGTPPYTPNIPESVPSTLRKKHRDFGLFVEGGKLHRGDSPQYKIEKLFISLLESIHPKDALLVLSMVAKTSPVKFLTKKLVQEALPKLIPET